VNVVPYCREIDSEGDEVDDDEPYKHAVVAAAGDDDDDADKSINYYVWYAVNINVCPAEPHDTLTVSCPCLVSTLHLHSGGSRSEWGGH